MKAMKQQQLIYVKQSEQAMQDNKIDTILKDRGSKYGDYANNASVTQNIMRALYRGENCSSLRDLHVEALHMIAHKMSRIVNGDPDLHDSWDDIAGYAKLVSERIPQASEVGSNNDE